MPRKDLTPVKSCGVGKPLIASTRLRSGDIPFWFTMYPAKLTSVSIRNFLREMVIPWRRQLVCTVVTFLISSSGMLPVTRISSTIFWAVVEPIMTRSDLAHQLSLVDLRPISLCLLYEGHDKVVQPTLWQPNTNMRGWMSLAEHLKVIHHGCFAWPWQGRCRGLISILGELSEGVVTNIFNF